MKVTFWGVRGSIPVPGPLTARYGGNTSCLEVQGANGECIILEAGSGIRPLGLNLIKRGFPLPEIFLFISHTHWDHIQGFPFFVPAYLPKVNIHIKGPIHFDETHSLREVFDMQMKYEFFPVSNEQLAAEISYEAVSEETITVGGVTIQSFFTNHPIRSLGYKLTENNKTFVYTGDHEPYRNIFGDESEAAKEEDDDLLFGGVDTTVDDANQRFVNIIQDTDLLVIDAQYTPDEYEKSKRGWGHSSWDYCLKWMRLSNTHKMILTHHEPLRGDEALDEVLLDIRKEAGVQGLDPTNVLLSREGMLVEV